MKEIKDKILRIRVTSAMYEELCAMAQERNTSLSGLIREIIENNLLEVEVMQCQ